MYNLIEQLKSWIIGLIKSREFIMILVFCALSFVLIHRCFNLQIVKGQEYLDDYKLQIQKTKEVQGTRGRILDRNGVVIADNKLAYSVTIEDNGDYSSTEEKNEILNTTISKIIDIVESNGDTIICDFKIVIGDNGEYEFSVGSETQRLRFLADVFGYATIDKLKPEERSYTADELITYLCAEKRYGIDQNALSKEEVLKMVNIRYAISLNRFQKYVATTVASDVSEETTAAIMENLDQLQGVNIEEDSLRYYPDSKYFANIIGYTGQISQAEYDNLNEEIKDNYSLTDIVGKAGIEQVMDSILQGQKGEIKLYVNSVGRVIQSVQGTEAKAGNDLYLSIDAELQKAAYDLLEEKLAGILLDKMRNVMNYDRNAVSEEDEVIIPIDEVYYAFFGNEIIDVGHMEDEDAEATEKVVYESFINRKGEVLSAIKTLLNNKNASNYTDSSKEMQAYQNYLVNTLLASDTEVLMTNKIDREDETYLAWREEETINIYTYLNYALSKNWIDTSKLSEFMGESSDYTDLTESYQALVEFICSELSSDSEFDKLIYKYMIKTQRITGRQIGLILYEQGTLEEDVHYEKLLNGSLGAYDFVRAKIETLEITPGQLGLEPCTGSVVVTDVNTGEVLACVSYPGYDNNKLANTMDSSYYSMLIHHQSAPLYNNATQEKTAPGSTYKPLVAIAGLTEGVISTGSIINCNGVFDTLLPATKCLGTHGGLDVVGGIKNSCNEYFCEVGYRLGISRNNLGDTDSEAAVNSFDAQTGLERLVTYASLFGLDETSGLEIPESEPQISDEDPARSAIGQGTNNYTTAQLARYITAVANEGIVYNLSLLEKAQTVEGTLVEDYEPEIDHEIEEVSSYTWTTVQKGMRAVIEKSSLYSSLGDFEISGKTGTAQQSTAHANHALFVGYAPSSNPEIAFAIRIKNGYTSQYTAEVGRDLIKCYYGLAERDEIITGRAASAGTVNGHVD